ncbi:uncharacterized protein [Drosophila takahashii]|uniref:uncharacterized protein n=1 Tax=Drosophila takahashii TaxID=29030 RepID=UPI0007E6E8CE|nr:uncharacterized protein LOC108068613 [Drosophila takahashii]XP_017013771.1 uncharacterized protein LOC108068613 [Drosophila takahashii]XP_017013772.1 uncharacterized protein LOC108068613 [Drosophila takahashii]
MKNNKLDMTNSKKQEKPNNELRKPLKRLNVKVRVMVSPKNASTIRLAKGNHQFPRRRPNTAYNNFLREFKRCNPGALTVEGASLWRKMSLEEKREFRVATTTRLQTDLNIRIAPDQQTYNEQLKDQSDSQTSS